MISDQVSISIVSVIGGIITAYIVNVAAKKVQSQRESKQPKDRIEQIFDSYDKILKQRDLDIRDLRVSLSEARHMNLVQNERLEEVEKSMQLTLAENEKLRDEIDNLRLKYRIHKNDPKKPGV